MWLAIKYSVVCLHLIVTILSLLITLSPSLIDILHLIFLVPTSGSPSVGCNNGVRELGCSRPIRVPRYALLCGLIQAVTHELAYRRWSKCTLPHVLVGCSLSTVCEFSARLCFSFLA
jgi:hypothetical protein